MKKEQWMEFVIIFNVHDTVRRLEIYTKYIGNINNVIQIC